MTEDFLQLVWEQRWYDATGMVTISGETVEVIAPGSCNRDAGPDFFNAKVKIGATLWAGNIEIHRNSSDWYRHRHHEDPVYENTILHVVHHYDRPVFRRNGELLPTLELTWPPRMEENYRKLLSGGSLVPCRDSLQLVDPLLLKIGFNRLMIERLEEKTGEINERLATNGHDWEETFYQFLARNFGFRTNALPFELLARSLPRGIPARHRDNLHQLEALFFGQSGLLHEELLGDDYFLSLREEYDFLARKYQLRPIAGHLWKFLRLRPVNFPTVRIAQFAALFYRAEALFLQILENPSLSAIRQLLEVTASPYWDTHYKFSLPARPQPKHLGEEAFHNLVINTLVPCLFVYGEQNGAPHLKERALEWLEMLPAEENMVVHHWAGVGVSADTAFESQALLQLKNRYCDRKRCLRCHIGIRLITLL